MDIMSIINKAISEAEDRNKVKAAFTAIAKALVEAKINPYALLEQAGVPKGGAAGILGRVGSALKGRPAAPKGRVVRKRVVKKDGELFLVEEAQDIDRDIDRDASLGESAIVRDEGTSHVR